MAKELIEERRYNDALIILKEVVENYPELQQEATVYLRKILDIQDQYQDILEEFEDAVRNEPDNLEKTLGLIEELRNIDENPNETLKRQIEQAEITALLRYNENIFNNIMDEAAVAIQNKEYQNAITIYKSGFTLHRDDYLSVNYGLLSTEMNSEIADIRNSTEMLIQEIDGFISSRDDFMKNLTDAEPSSLTEIIQEFRTPYNKQTDAYFTLKDSANHLRSYRDDVDRITENPSLLALRHVEYMELITLGREGRDEGLAEVVSLVLQNITDDSGQDAVERWKEEFEKAQSAFEIAEYGRAESSYRTSGVLLEAALEVLNLQQRLIRLSDGYRVHEGKNIAFRLLPLHVETRAVIKMAELKADMSEEIQTFLERYEQNPGTLPELSSDQLFFRGYRELFLEYLKNWEQTAEPYRNLNTAYIPAARKEELVSLSAEIEDWRDLSENREILLTGRIAEIKFYPLDDTYDSITGSFNQGQTYLEGIKQQVSTGNGRLIEVTSSYPDRARNIFNEVIQDLTSLRRNVTSYVSDIRDEPEYLVISEPVSRWIGQGEELLEKINQLLNSTIALRTEAREKIALAEELRESGFDRFSEAEDAYNGITTIDDPDFDRIGGLIEEAGEFFYRSVSNQEDIPFRREYDQLLKDLEEKVKRKLHELILVRVAEYVEEGRQFYLQNEFPRAEQVLLDADRLWDRTNPIDPHPQVEQWLNLTTIALNQEQAREIPETHPSYPSIMNLLNYARENFEAGQTLLDKGSRKDAVEVLDAARDKLLTVTTEFPFNKDAGVLTLKILQILNPDNFDELFTQKVTEARNNLAQNPDEAYYDLLDLKEIKPNYPGLDNLIYQAEILTGRRIPPPDKNAQQRAEQLYREALAIYENENQARYAEAITNLNQALDINPDYQEAASLWDRLQLEQGSEVRFTLSSAAYEQYQRALDYFINGNYALAYRETSLLLQNEENLGYSPLIQLHDRLKRELGVDSDT
ncbi:MAG: hypothetical protein ACLFST_00805 [Spirochaetia bacterium]